MFDGAGGSAAVAMAAGQHGKDAGCFRSFPVSTVPLTKVINQSRLWRSVRHLLCRCNNYADVCQKVNILSWLSHFNSPNLSLFDSRPTA